MWHGLKQKIKKGLRRPIAALVREILQEELDKQLQVARQMEEFQSTPPCRRASFIEAQTSIPALLEEIRALGIPLRTVSVDHGDFAKWRLEYAALDAQYRPMGDAALEKVLEHYLTMKYLPISAGDTVIDMAAAGSNFADLLAKKSHQSCYKLDLAFAPGRIANRIGADAARTGLPDSFADALTFHCAFECLQGDADIHFPAEARRILKEGGHWGIVPLYLDQRHFVKLGPKHDRRAVKFSENEHWAWRDDAYLASPFSRHYSPESFSRRILAGCSGFTYEILHFDNLDELRQAHPGQRLYCHFLFRAMKK